MNSSSHVKCKVITKNVVFELWDKLRQVSFMELFAAIDGGLS